MPETFVEVWDDDILAGHARLHPSGDGMGVEFEYDRGFLTSSQARQIDPALDLYEGIHVAQNIPGCFADATPDAWGKFLIRNALRSEGARRHPDAVDYLLNVSDITRQGSLRFRVDGQFVRVGTTIPRHIALADLARKALEAEHNQDSQLVRELWHSGAEATGGAVPKATVLDDEGALWIAKFYPGDTGRWEKVAFDLAARAGLDVPDTRLVSAGTGSILLSRRFDREGSRRVPYLSAASLIQRNSWDSADYADIADGIRDHGATPTDDLQQLWHRMAFLVAVNSADDHLRNHGFVWQADGWRLSPMFDVVPTDSTERKTSIHGQLEREAMVDSLLASADYFEVSDPTTDLRRIWTLTRPWRDIARTNGLGPAAVDTMEAAFEGLRAAVEQVTTKTD